MFVSCDSVFCAPLTRFWIDMALFGILRVSNSFLHFTVLLCLSYDAPFQVLEICLPSAKAV